jgi:hypothetical protein
MLPFKKYLSESCDCWKGHKRVPGTKPCAPGSCVKEAVELDEAHTHELEVSYDKNQQRARGKVRVTAASHEEAKEKALSSMKHEKNVKVHTSKSPDSSIAHHFKEERGLWDNIHAKQKRIKAGSAERMRKPGSTGAPTDAALKASQTNEALDKKDPHGDYRKKRKVLDDLAKNKHGDQKDVAQRRLSLDTEYASHNRNALLFKREEFEAQFDLIEEYVEELSMTLDIHADVIWEKFEPVDDVELYEAAVDAKGHKSSTGGLTQKGRDAYNAKGANLQAPVTTPPSKLKAGSKSANRRKSFCARMGGMEGPMKDDKGRPTRKALALRKWNC